MQIVFFTIPKWVQAPSQPRIHLSKHVLWQWPSNWSIDLFSWFLCPQCGTTLPHYCEWEWNWKIKLMDESHNSGTEINFSKQANFSEKLLGKNFKSFSQLVPTVIYLKCYQYTEKRQPQASFCLREQDDSLRGTHLGFDMSGWKGTRALENFLSMLILCAVYSLLGLKSL